MHNDCTNWVVQDYCKIGFYFISIVLNSIIIVKCILSIDIACTCHAETRPASCVYYRNVQMV